MASADAAGVVRIWAPESLAADAARGAVLLCGAPVTALAWDARADKIMCVPTLACMHACMHACAHLTACAMPALRFR